VSATLSPYGRGALLTAFFTPDIHVSPAGLWLAHTRDIPVSNDHGDTIDEPVDDAGAALGGYARLALGDLTSDNWGFTGFAEIFNLNSYVWPAATGAWGLIQGWVLLDVPDLGEGNVIAAGELIETFQINAAGDTPPPVDVGGLAFGIYD
jgi:hypothetical protein